MLNVCNILQLHCSIKFVFYYTIFVYMCTLYVKCQVFLTVDVCLTENYRAMTCSPDWNNNMIGTVQSWYCTMYNALKVSTCGQFHFFTCNSSHSTLFITSMYWLFTSFAFYLNASKDDIICPPPIRYRDSDISPSLLVQSFTSELLMMRSWTIEQCKQTLHTSRSYKIDQWS